MNGQFSEPTGETNVDDPIMPTPEPDGDEMGSNGEICVPLQALAMPDQQDQMEAPVMGDKVQANIEGTVTRIEGENAYLKLDAVNGQKLDKEQTPSDTDAPDAGMAQLQGMAANMPEKY